MLGRCVDHLEGLVAIHGERLFAQYVGARGKRSERDIPVQRRWSCNDHDIGARALDEVLPACEDTVNPVSGRTSLV
jgi:hypothetical protein